MRRPIVRALTGSIFGSPGFGRIIGSAGFSSIGSTGRIYCGKILCCPDFQVSPKKTSLLFLHQTRIGGDTFLGHWQLR
jgi:hypothetical protein